MSASSYLGGAHNHAPSGPSPSPLVSSPLSSRASRSALLAADSPAVAMQPIPGSATDPIVMGMRSSRILPGKGGGMLKGDVVEEGEEGGGDRRDRALATKKGLGREEPEWREVEGA